MPITLFNEGAIMPITLFNEGDLVEVIKLKGDDKIIKHLQELGFGKGRKIKLQSFDGVNYIFSIDDNRFALNKDLAKKIIVREVA